MNTALSVLPALAMAFLTWPIMGIFVFVWIGGVIAVAAISAMWLMSWATERRDYLVVFKEARELEKREASS